MIKEINGFRFSSIINLGYNCVAILHCVVVEY